MTKSVPISRWGKDHWSTLAYLETIAVDHGPAAAPYRERMRCDPDIHPHMENQGNRFDPGARYPTRLAGGEELPGHDDWSCLEDAVTEGLLVDAGTGARPAYKFTPLGLRVIAKLRAHKQGGGNYGDFAAG